MTLVPTRAILDRTTRGRAAFNVVHLETAEALAGAADDTGMPLILQISENCAAYHGALAPVAAAVSAIARASDAPIAVHLDHAVSEALALEAIDLGFGSVMFDGATLPFAENVAATRRVVQAAHAAGVLVEAELGEIGGKDGAHAPGVRTDPLEAAQFADATGVDALAVAVGSSHAMTDRTAVLDLELIARLHEAVDIPLVLHGSSGVDDENLRAAVAAGIAKVNIATQLTKQYTQAVRRALADRPALVDSRTYTRAGRDAVRAEAARLLALLDAAAPVVSS